MNDETEVYEITVAEWLAETPKAYQVRSDQGTEHWLPKGQVMERGEDYVLIPMWLAQKARIAKTIEAGT